MSSSKQQAVIYLDRNKFYFFGSNILDRILTLDISPKVISDLEVRNKDELSILIKTFIEFYKIIPAKIILVLSESTYFVKDLAMDQDIDIDPSIQKFIDLLPFENISNKPYKSDSGMKIIATNMDLCQAIINIFAKLGFSIEAVIPELIIGKDQNLKNIIDINTAKLVLERFDSWKQNNLFSEQQAKYIDHYQENRTEEQKKTNLYVLLPIFFLLIAVLVILLLTQQLSSTARKSTIITPTAKPIIPTTVSSPTNTKTPEVITPKMNTMDVENVKIQILNSKGVFGQAEMLKNQLNSLGFKNVDVGESTINTPKTIMVFSQNLPTILRDNLISQLKERGIEVSAQETNDTRYDASIIIGQSINPESSQ